MPSRYLAVKDDIKASLPKRGGKARLLTKEDFSQKSSIFLKKEAQFDYLVSLRDSDNRAKAVIGAMESIAAAACFKTKDKDDKIIHPLADFETALAEHQKTIQPFLKTVENSPLPWGEGFGVRDLPQQLNKAGKTFASDIFAFQKSLKKEHATWKNQAKTNVALNKATGRIAPLAETSRDLIKQAHLLYKLACRLIDVCEGELEAKKSEHWVSRDVIRARKAADLARQIALTQLKQVRYFHKQAVWLTDRFPKAELCDVEGLVKLVDKKDLKANDWSLTPGRYVGVAPEEEDWEFDFGEALRDIHVGLEGLNAEAVGLAANIKKNFEKLGG